MAERVDAEYRFALEAPAGARQATAKELPLPWEGAGGLAFAHGEPSTPRRAFGAGLWTGRAALLGRQQALPDNLSPAPGTPWQDSEWADYFQLGRWMALVWTASRSGEVGVYWKDSRASLDVLQASLRKRAEREREADLAVARLDAIVPLLDEMSVSSPSAGVRPGTPAAGPSGADDRSPLTREIERAIQQLAP